jgi:HlyD family secretion protein
LSSVVIEAQVAEADVGRIEAGMQARFTVDAFPRERFFGVASPVRRSPQTDGRFVSYPVLIEASDPDERLLPGMTASVEFIAAESRDVLVAPRRALTLPPPPGFQPPDDIADYVRTQIGLGPGEPLPDTPEVASRVYGSMLGQAIRDNMRILFVWDSGRVEVRRVRPGAEDETHFEVLAGEVEEGDLIVVDAEDDRFQ